MTVADLEFADAVRAAAGWNQTLEDWRRFLRFEPDGCFLAEVQGQPAGTATTTRYGMDLGWIGMVLVDPQFRRRGVATALMDAALEFLSGRVRCIKLDATPDGAKVYERLGFQPEWELSRWAGSGQAISEGREISLIRPMPFDSEVFGADRGRWLADLAESASFGQQNSEAFGILRRGSRADYLGPATAANSEAGAALTRSLLNQLSRETFWDIPEPNKAAISLAAEFNFERVRPLLRMWAGDRQLPSRPELQFAIGDPATG